MNFYVPKIINICFLCILKVNKKFWEEVIAYLVFRGCSVGITDERNL
jgi:hypothetical protein